MNSQPSSFFMGRRPLPALITANDPIGGIEDSVPVSPDSGLLTPKDIWQEQIDKKRPPKKRKSEQPKPPRPGSGNHIDDYA